MNIDFLTGLILGGLGGALIASAICWIIAVAIERRDKRAAKGGHDR